MKFSHRNTATMPAMKKISFLPPGLKSLPVSPDSPLKSPKLDIYKTSTSPAQSTHPSLFSTQSCPISARKEVTHERLKQRMLERELVKSCQRIQNETVSLISLDPQTCSEKVHSKTLTFKNPAQSVHSKQAAFEKYNHLPENKIKLVLNERILRYDEAAVEAISKNIQKELQEESYREDVLKFKREEARNKLKQRKDRNTHLEVKSGIIRSKSATVINKAVSNRLLKLAQPKRIQVNYMEATDFHGLFNRDYYEAVESIKGSKAILECSRTTASKFRKEPFQFPDSLITSKGFFIHEKHLVSRPASTSYFTRVKKYETPAKDPKEELAIKESMRDLNKFDSVYRNYKGRQGFPGIQLGEQMHS